MYRLVIGIEANPSTSHSLSSLSKRKKKGHWKPNLSFASTPAVGCAALTSCLDLTLKGFELFRHTDICYFGSHCGGQVSAAGRKGHIAQDHKPSSRDLTHVTWNDFQSDNTLRRHPAERHRSDFCVLRMDLRHCSDPNSWDPDAQDWKRWCFSGIVVAISDKSLVGFVRRLKWNGFSLPLHRFKAEQPNQMWRRRGPLQNAGRPYFLCGVKGSQKKACRPPISQCATPLPPPPHTHTLNRFRWPV